MTLKDVIGNFIKDKAKIHGRLAFLSTKGQLNRPDGRSEEERKRDPATEFVARDRHYRQQKIRTHARMGGKKPVQAHIHTHIAVKCNIKRPCWKHKDGKPHMHYIVREAWDSMKDQYV